MRKLAVLAIICTVVAGAQAGTLLNTLDMLAHGYSMGNGNHEGGASVFGKNYGLQLAQPFKTTAENIITEVEIGNLTFGVAQPANAVVAVFDLDNNTPVYRATHAVTKNTPFTDSVFGLVGLRSTIGGLNIALNANSNYMIAVQTIDSDWAYTARRSATTNGDARMRDNSSFGYQGGYGFTTWRTGANSGFGPGEAAYRVEAVPEPTALVLLGLGALGLIRRR